MDGPNEMLLVFVRPLNQLGMQYMITGSAASMAYGEPRMTLDVDLVLELPFSRIRDLVNAFPEDQFYCPPEDVIRLEAQRDTRGHFNVIHTSTGFKADIYPAGRDELHRWGLARTTTVLVEREAVPVAPAEYVILRKLEYYREGGSAKHVRDIQGMLRVSGSSIDRPALEEWIRRMRLSKEWDECLADS